MISIRHHGNFEKTTSFLGKLKNPLPMDILHSYGRQGVEALASMTPVDTGKTASMWYYDIVESNGRVELVFGNKNIQNEVSIAVILQYGHGTRNGGWVEGRDYINPSIQPVFDEIAKRIGKVVG